MMKAYWKDIWRTISREKKRFLSIVIIAALGVTMMCGLRAGCMDLRYSADQFFDRQNLFDIKIVSTLGLTDADIDALKNTDQVETAEGGYNETVYTMADGVRKSIDLRTLSREHINMPYLQEGQMPKSTSDILITRSYWLETGKQVGDVIRLQEEAEGFKNKEYRISGIVIDALDINSTEGSMGFRSTATTDYVGYVLPEAADAEVYTAVYLVLKGGKGLNCYSQAYTQSVDAVTENIETELKEKRELARYEEVHGEAMDEWLEGKAEADEEFAKADKEIADAKEELREGRQEVADARKELKDGRQELQDGEAELESQEAKANKEFQTARQTISDGYQEVNRGKKELEKAFDQLEEGQKQLDDAKEELEKQEAAAGEQFQLAWQELETNEQTLQMALAQWEEASANYEAIKDTLDEATRLATEEQLALQKAELDAGLQQLELGKQELTSQEEAAKLQFEEGYRTLEEKQAELDAGRKSYREGVQELNAAKKKLDSGKQELNQQEARAKREFQKARDEISSGWKELKDGEKELKKGEQELADGEQELEEAILEYQEERAEAEQELADAKKEIDEIERPKWYVQDRTALSGYSNVKNDADSIQAIGNIFPILFLTVAILISLTTITRMVEEERGLIGTYKALGFTDGEICRKYWVYSSLACLVGGVLGYIGGYIVLPLILFIVFRIMYLIPEYSLQMEVLFGFSGILLFEVGVVGATLYSCRKSLKKTPATLMRPKAPKAGTRVFLERLTFIWKRLTFLNKVTARNLFRYKKRLLMTIFGIAGCTALLLCAFTIKDTVAEMLPQQYEVVYSYDLMAVTDAKDLEELELLLQEEEEIGSYLAVGMESADLYNSEGKKESVQLVVVPDGNTLEGYIYLKTKDGQKVTLSDEQVLVTRNATRTLDLEIGETIRIQNLDLEEAEIEMTQIVENYFGNTVYLTETMYEKLFGTFEANAVYAKFAEKCEDEKAYTDALKRKEMVLSANCTQAMKDEFSSAFRLLNMIVVVILVLAALLAFVVLFTLSNTNISERERELATIKVLGFYHGEVHSYVNKETWILTSFGILFGMPLGWLIGRYVMGILKLSSLEFYIDLYPQSYLYAALITVVFGFVVNLITNRVLDRINMVEALKSVE